MAVAVGRLAAVVLCMCLAAACGGGSADGSLAVRAGAATTAAGSFRVAVESRTFDQGDPEQISGIDAQTFADIEAAVG